MLEAITLDGANITAATDAYLHDYFIGCEGVFQKGRQINCEVVSNNLVKLLDGLILNSGRFVRIHPGTYEEIIIDNSAPEVNRIDLIISHFETDSIAEILDIRVIKGANDGKMPKLIKGDVFNGDLINQVPLYAVHVDGVTDFYINDLRSFIPTPDDVKNAALFDCGETDSAYLLGAFAEWVAYRNTLNLEVMEDGK